MENAAHPPSGDGSYDESAFYDKSVPKWRCPARAALLSWARCGFVAGASMAGAPVSLLFTTQVRAPRARARAVSYGADWICGLVVRVRDEIDEK